MLCRNPFIQGLAAYPCGRCEPCLRQRRRTWTHRILLEQSLRSDNAFVTLTYADHPQDGPPVSLTPKHLQDWLKRFRKAISPLKIRYYAVGEYGEKSQRPHYHAALFGYPSCICHLRNQNRPTKRWVDCPVCRVVKDTWTHGNVLVAQLELRSAQYIAGYILKKMTHRNDPRLDGRDPEFSRMSLRPGIGHDMMYETASSYLQYDLEHTEADVPVSLRHGSKQLPLGRYLRKKLRLMVGKDEKAPQAIIDAQAEEMRALYFSKLSDPSFVSIKTALVEMDDGKVASQNAREKIHKPKRTI